VRSKASTAADPARKAASAGSPCSTGRYTILPWPMPCSPVQGSVPAHARRDLRGKPSLALPPQSLRRRRCGRCGNCRRQRSRQSEPADCCQHYRARFRRGIRRVARSERSERCTTYCYRRYRTGIAWARVVRAHAIVSGRNRRVLFDEFALLQIRPELRRDLDLHGAVVSDNLLLAGGADNQGRGYSGVAENCSAAVRRSTP
jgi:hypothetical protein